MTKGIPPSGARIRKFDGFSFPQGKLEVNYNPVGGGIPGFIWNGVNGVDLVKQRNYDLLSGTIVPTDGEVSPGFNLTSVKMDYGTGYPYGTSGNTIGINAWVRADTVSGYDLYLAYGRSGGGVANYNVRSQNGRIEIYSQSGPWDVWRSTNVVLTAKKLYNIYLYKKYGEAVDWYCVVNGVEIPGAYSSGSNTGVPIWGSGAERLVIGDSDGNEPWDGDIYFLSVVEGGSRLPPGFTYNPETRWDLFKTHPLIPFLKPPLSATLTGDVTVPLTIASDAIEGRSILGDITVASTTAAIMLGGRKIAGAVTVPVLVGGIVSNIDCEEGDLTDFDDTTNIGDITVTTGAAQAGIYGLNIPAGSTNRWGVKDFTQFTDDEIHLYCRLDPNTVDFASGQSNVHAVTLYNSLGEPILSIRYFSTIFATSGIIANLWDDGGAARSVTHYETSNPHEVEAVLNYASSDVASDASLALYIDGVLHDTETGEDLFDRAKPDEVRVGQVAGAHANWSGTYFVDDVTYSEGAGLLTGTFGTPTELNYTLNASITGAVTVTSTIVATFEGPQNQIEGDVTVISAIASAMDYTRNADITGVVTVSSTIASGMVANTADAIIGGITVTPSIAAIMLEGRVIDGSIAVGSTVAAAMEFSADAAIVGDITITTSIAADFDFARVFIGDITVTLDIMAGLVPDTGIEAQIAGVGVITATLTIDATTVEQTFRNEISPLERFVPDEFTSEGRQWLQDKLEEINSALVRNSQGVPLTPIQNIQGVFPTATFPLGTLSSFHHPSYGLLYAVFCEFANMVGTILGSPVGFDAIQDVLQWKVTNDFSSSAENALVGLLAAAEVPASGKFGWVITHGANIHRVGIKTAELNNQFDLLGWSGDNEISSTATVKQLQQITSGTRDSGYGYNPGELLIRA